MVADRSLFTVKKIIFSLIDNVIKANELNYISRGMVIADIN